MLDSTNPLAAVTNEELLGYCGGFWAELAPNPDFLHSLASGELLLANNAVQKIDDAANLSGLINAPIFYNPNYKIFKLALSDMVWNGMESEYYEFFDFPNTPNFAAISTITNNPVTDDIELVPNVDFIIDRDLNRIRFTSNPFLNSNLSIITQDTEQFVWLWAVSPQIDDKYLYKHYGYIVGIEEDSSADYKKLLEIVWSALTTGTSRLHILELLALVYDIELIDEIPTNPGFDLIDTIGGYLDPRIEQIIFNPEFLSPLGYYDVGIGFENKLVTPIINSGELSWETLGPEDEVDAFWDSVREKETQTGVSLLDAIENVEGPLPAQINPLEYILRYVLDSNVLILIKPEELEPVRFGNLISGLIRRLLPPGQVLLYANEELDMLPSPSPSPSP